MTSFNVEKALLQDNFDIGNHPTPIFRDHDIWKHLFIT